MNPNNGLSALLYGSVHFGADEEHREFQYRMLIWGILGAAAVTAVRLLGSWLGIQVLRPAGFAIMAVFTAVSLGFWWALRGRKQWFGVLAWSYLVVVFVQCVSLWYWTASDELRVVWLMVNVPAAYIVLGQRAGALLTVLSLGVLWCANGLSPWPYTSNALTTFSLALGFLAVFFHLYVDRSQSYYTRLRETNHQLLELATHDPLTSLLNTRAFSAQANRLLAMAERQQQVCAMLFLDLDHFKRINDSYGHATGDVVLRAVAQALAAQLRESDVLGRVGGEEFAIFLPNTGLLGAVKLAESLRQRVEALPLNVGSEGTLNVTISVGVAAQPARTGGLEAMQVQADEAMYQAKAQGRNRVVASTAAVSTIAG